MKIDQDHLYYGAAVIQIAEDPSFTAINDFKKSNKPVRCAYWVNQNIGIYLKYRSGPDRTTDWDGKAANEYLFVFNQEALRHLASMNKQEAKLFLGLICVEDRQICCLPHSSFQELVERRRQSKGGPEDQYTIVVSLPKRSAFRVYVTPCVVAVLLSAIPS